jgi:four helix bundle protein
MSGFKSLLAYKKGFELAAELFIISKSFPKEETYSLTDQVRRSSRSVCACIAEAYRKRIYPAHFVSKLTDADMENAETLVWIDFAENCNYISKELHQKLISQNDEVGKLINYMINNPEKFR